MSNLTPHQRQALNYKEHISLTANAGSGKTFVLAKRYIEIALHENVSLRNIVAITFTEKAASELYKKVSDEIELRISITSDAYEKKRLEIIREQLVSANISTIHSFCVGILREYPVESDIDANFAAIEQEAAEEIIQLSIEEVIRRNFEDPDKKEKLKYLIRLFASKTILFQILSILINKRKNLIKVASTIYSKNVEEIQKYFYNVFEEYLTGIIDNEKPLIYANITEINNAVLDKKPDNSIAKEVKYLSKQLMNEKEFGKLFEILTGIKNNIFTKSLAVKKQGYLKDDRELYSSQIEYLENIFSELNQFQIDGDHEIVEYELANLGKILIDLFNEILLLYTEKKRKNGYLDFEDILLYAQKLLSNDEVRNALGCKFKYIMVDEYQDTNEIQYEIFMPILDYLRKGNLFVVGDEKQSIYMFRDAELEIFNRTKVNITQISGEYNLLNLPDSFRMAPAICLFTNYLFEKLFRNPNISFNEVNYNALVCAKEESTPGGVEILLADADDPGKSEAELTARRIIRIIKDNVTENIEFNDIAVLCRKRKSFEELEKVFNKYKIPYNIIGGKGFYQRQFIYDIYNYLSFLFNPKNDAALIGILRSPFFSLSDAEIFEISLVKKNNFWEKFRSYSEKFDHLKTIYELLKNNVVIANKLDLTTLLRKIINETSFIAVLSSKPDSEQELANLEKFISIATSFRSTGYKTLYDFICFLDNAINSTDDESQASVSNIGDSVKIMTLHQAKGLEFKAVFLYSCHDYTSSDIVKTKSVSINKELGILTTVPVKEHYFEDYKAAPIVTLHNYIMKKKNIAEIKRLFYVGVTRAKNYLFITSQNRNLRYHPESFMKFLLEGLEMNRIDENPVIESDLTFLMNTGKEYCNETKLLKLEIPIVTELNEEQPFETGNILEDVNHKQIKIQPIEDFEEDELISATRFTMYNHCPLKYQLTYELGYLKLSKNLNMYRQTGSIPVNDEKLNLDFNHKEEKEIYNLATIKGKVIHQILEREIPLSQAKKIINRAVKNETEMKSYDKERIKFLEGDIWNYLKTFYSSDTYKELAGYKNYKNGFEVYSKEYDYFLHGVINKLIFDGDRVIIVNYKTDNIDLIEAEKRADEYKRQMHFYGLLIDRLIENKKSIESWIVFIKDPVIIKDELAQDDFQSVRKEIRSMVKNTRNKIFMKNENHCKICHYFGNQTCIIT